MFVAGLYSMPRMSVKKLTARQLNTPHECTAGSYLIDIGLRGNEQVTIGQRLHIEDPFAV